LYSRLNAARTGSEFGAKKHWLPVTAWAARARAALAATFGPRPVRSRTASWFRYSSTIAQNRDTAMDGACVL
jgi:hypothetical protein